MEVDELPTINPDVDYEQSCESRLMQFEHKLQKVEASLLILESQLASIPDLNSIGKNESYETKSVVTNENEVDAPVLDLPEVPTEVNIEAKETGPKACEDSRFVRFFKMVQFGVPLVAVKLKMQNEGVDPNILDKPNEVIPGYVLENSNDTESSSNT